MNTTPLLHLTKLATDPDILALLHPYLIKRAIGLIMDQAPDRQVTMDIIVSPMGKFITVLKPQGGHPIYIGDEAYTLDYLEIPLESKAPPGISLRPIKGSQFCKLSIPTLPDGFDPLSFITRDYPLALHLRNDLKNFALDHLTQQASEITASGLNPHDWLEKEVKKRSGPEHLIGGNCAAAYTTTLKAEDLIHLQHHYGDLTEAFTPSRDGNIRPIAPVPKIPRRYHKHKSTTSRTTSNLTPMPSPLARSGSTNAQLLEAFTKWLSTQAA